MTTNLDKPPVQEPRRRRDRTHWLYIAVIVAVLAGIAVGLVFARGRQGRRRARHDVRQPDQDDDRAGHLLHDRAGHRLGAQGRQRRQGRRPGAGLLPGDVDRSRWPSAWWSATCIHPGSGLHLSESAAGKGAELAEKAHESGGLMDFILHIIPTTLFSALTEGNVLQALFVALLVGFALQAMGKPGRADPARHRASCRSWCSRSSSMIMWLAPIGAFGAIAGVVGADRLDRRRPSCGC